LGGGLRANFNLEYGISNNLVGDTVRTSTTGTNSSTAGVSAANGGSDIQTRTSRLGLESAKLGRVDIGYGVTGLFATVTGHSPLPGNNFIGDVAYSAQTSSGAFASGTAATNATSRILTNAVRMSGVQYTSPTINGLQAVVDYGSGSFKNGDQGVTDSRVSNAGLTLRYTAGALALAATTHTLKSDYAADSNAINTQDYNVVSARYAVSSNLALNALYGKNKTVGQANTQTAKNDVTQVGVSYTMGKNQLVAQYGEGEGEGAPGVDRRDRKGYQVGAIHNLSKRTNVYAIYGSQEAKFVTTTNVGNTEKVSGFAAGIRHSF